jgi:hypothetical protein
MNAVPLLEAPVDASTGRTQPAPTELICVCCNCDRIRLRSGLWREDHTPLAGERRSHGICPECFAELYPEYAQHSSVR